MEKQYRNILCKIVNNQYALITINRPEFRNAVNDETTQELHAALDQIEKYEDLCAVVITGAGEKAFCAGADLKKILDKTATDILKHNMQDLCFRLENFRLPTIAAINGASMGGGFELVMSCDLRIATEGAVFSLPEPSLGLIPSAGGTQRLARLIGESRAKQVIMLGERMTAKEAEQAGLLYKVVGRGELEKTYEEMVEKIKYKAPTALYFSKLSMNSGIASYSYVAMKYEKMCQAVLMESDEKKEGIQAFFEKRPPLFR